MIIIFWIFFSLEQILIIIFWLLVFHEVKGRVKKNNNKK
jgi:hypothetical protein